MDDEVDVQEQILDRRLQLTEALASLPYDLIHYLERAVVHSNLGYPDLAAGDAYRALLLCDEVANEGFEYHEQAIESLQMHVGVALPDVLSFGALQNEWSLTPGSNPDGPTEAATIKLAMIASARAYQILSLSLLLCGCLKSAYTFCERGLQIYPSNKELLDVKGHINTFAFRKLQKTDYEINDLPDEGLVRREVYPWNGHEPDRFAPRISRRAQRQLGRYRA